MQMESLQKYHTKSGKPVSPKDEILLEFEKNGFFKKLNLDKNGVWIRFNSLQDKQYCINYGVWLELYVYVAAGKQRCV